MGKTKIKEIKVEETQPELAEEEAAEELLQETEQEIANEAAAEVKNSSLDNSIESVMDDSANKTKSAAKGKTEPSKNKKPKKGHKVRSKKYLEKAKSIEKAKLYPLEEAVEAVKNSSYSKFDGTFEVHINTNAKNLRGLISLPFTAGKKLTILAFGKDAQDSGADQIGDDQKITEIQKGKIDFDIVVSTPDWMPKLAKVASVLGPRGLMPNPKNGTINPDLKKAVADLQGGKTEYKTEKGGQVIHLSVGKVSQPTDQIAQNIKILLTTIGKSRVTKITLSPTMGPAVKLNLSSI